MLLQKLLNIRFFTLLGIATLATTGCTKSELSGNVYLTYGAGDVKPVAGAEVYLWPGTPEDIKEAVGEPYAAWATSYIDERALTELQSSKRDLARQIAEIRAQIDSLNQESGWADWDDIESCHKSATLEWQSSERLDVSPDRIREELNNLARSRTDARETLKSAERNLATKVEATTTALKQKYMDKEISLTVSNNVVGCCDVTFTNYGDLAVRSVDIAPAYRGKPVFSAEQAEDFDFRGHIVFDALGYGGRQNKYGEIIEGLAPGESWNQRGVFIAPSPSLKGSIARQLEGTGLSYQDYDDLREFIVVDIDLTNKLERKYDDEEFTTTFPKAPIEDVFARQIESATASEVAAVRAARSDLTSVEKALAHTRFQLSRLETLVKVCKDGFDLLSAKTSLEAKGFGEAVSETSTTVQRLVSLAKAIAIRPQEQSSLVRSYFESELRETGGDVVYWRSGEAVGEEAITEVFANVLTAASSTRTDIKGAYQFADIRSASYVLICGTNVNSEDEVWWFVPVSVNGSTSQELANFNLEEGHLVQHLATFAIGYIQGLPDEQPE